VLPEDGPSDRTASQVCGELQRQLQDPTSDLRCGEFGRFAANASLSVDGKLVARASSGDAVPPPPATLPETTHFGSGCGAADPTPFSSQGWH
ncbi:unnamed protein product, partial [Effrenium voratum]